MKDAFDELISAIQRCHEKCPWIKEQTVEKHGKEVLSEAKEVVEAIEKKDYENLKEELGDLLWDTITLALLAEKEGLFKAKEIMDVVISKMKRRLLLMFGWMEKLI